MNIFYSLAHDHFSLGWCLWGFFWGAGGCGENLCEENNQIRWLIDIIEARERYNYGQSDFKFIFITLNMSQQRFVVGKIH